MPCLGLRVPSERTPETVRLSPQATDPALRARYQHLSLQWTCSRVADILHSWQVLLSRTKHDPPPQGHTVHFAASRLRSPPSTAGK